jgi:hypothetical protein
MTLKKHNFQPDLGREENYERRNIIRNELERNLFNETLKPLNFRIVKKNKNDCYIEKNISKSCILDYLNIYFSSKLKVAVGNRNEIIRKVKVILKDCSPFNIIRTDISNFYESIDRDLLLKKILGFDNFPQREVTLLEQYFSELTRLNIKGLPRGMGLSSTLSEFYLKDFDFSLTSISNLYFYARYVDDIIIFLYKSSNTSDGLIQITNALPNLLTLNVKKTKVITLPKATKSKNEPHYLSFLGYEFHTDNSKYHSHRQLYVKMAERKVNEYKRKIAKSFKAYSHNPQSFELLLSRVQYLTGNVILPQRGDNRKLKTGIFYNYPELSDYKSNGLLELDQFLKMNIYSTGCRISDASSKLSLIQKRKLSKYSFVKGHELKFLQKIEIEKMMVITRAFSSD